MLDRQRRPLHWFDPQRGLTLPVERPLASSHSLRFAYSALLDVATGVLVHVDDEGQYQGRYPTHRCRRCSTARWGCDLMIDWSWVIDNHAMIGDLLWQHARMVLLALLFGSLLTGGLLAVTLRCPRDGAAAHHPVRCALYHSLAGAVYFIAAVYRAVADHLADWPDAVLLLILLRNVLAGMEKLPQAALESARALGYTRGFRFFDIELWLLLPSLFAGLRNCLGDAGRPGHRHCADRPGAGWGSCCCWRVLIRTF